MREEQTMSHIITGNIDKKYCRDFINIFSRKDSGLDRLAKLFELNFLTSKPLC